ncbi:hypothetical protein [Vibrio parahaemolyticus]|uniref:hypothetical protein n=1 Tax=Vibrio parahaemolyticus TaxID=670 RepID=UPI0028785E63|nr:hypothetical protein [Vibrio parahaemolyticus]MDS1911575.1 hypothetical protein [Vibrio parahaemolyticus]
MFDYERWERVFRRCGISHNDFRRIVDFFMRENEEREYIKHKLYAIDRKLEQLPDCKCKYQHSDAGNMQLLVGDGDSAKKRRAEKKYLAKWLSKCKNNLIISDPYFFQYGSDNKVFSSLTEYTDFICELIPNDIRSLEVFHLPGPQGEVKMKIHKTLRSRNIKLTYIETNEIHDRVFIRDQDEAVLVGTSLGGYGNKLAFVLDLPNEDLENFKAALEKIRQK